MACCPRINVAAVDLAAGSLDRDQGVAAGDPGHGNDHVPVTDVHVHVIGADHDPDQNVLGRKNADGSLRRAEEAVLAVDIVHAHDLGVPDHVDHDLDRKTERRDHRVEGVDHGLAANAQSQNPGGLDPSLNPDPLNPNTLKNPRTKIKREEAKTNRIMARRMTGTKLIKRRAKRNQAKRRNPRRSRSPTKKAETRPRIAKVKRKQSLKLKHWQNYGL